MKSCWSLCSGVLAYAESHASTFRFLMFSNGQPLFSWLLLNQQPEAVLLLSENKQCNGNKGCPKVCKIVHTGLVCIAYALTMHNIIPCIIPIITCITPDVLTQVHLEWEDSVCVYKEKANILTIFSKLIYILLKSVNVLRLLGHTVYCLLIWGGLGLFLRILFA